MNKLTAIHHGIRAAQHSKPTAPILVLGLALLLSLTAGPSSSFAADPSYAFNVVTTIGSSAPGGGAFGSDFEPTALNNHGQLAFTAEPDVLSALRWSLWTSARPSTPVFIAGRT